MKKLLLITLILLVTSLSGCTVNQNPFDNEDEIIFQSEDESVRLEIKISTSTVNRLLIQSSEQEPISFVVNYFVPTDKLDVYLDKPSIDSTDFIYQVKFESKNFLNLNYDVMHLEDCSKNETNIVHSNLNVTL